MAEQSRAAALLDPHVDLDALAADPEARAALRAGTLPLPLLADGTLPPSVAALDATLAAYRDELALTDQSREALGFLLWPRLPAALKAGYLPLAAGTSPAEAAAARRAGAEAPGRRVG